MKPHILSARRSFFSTALTVAGLALTAPIASATPYYWDVNGNGTGFSTVVGAWDTGSFWGPNASGTGGTYIANPTAADDLNIVKATTTNAGTITVTGGQSASSIAFVSGVGAVTIAPAATGTNTITIGGTGTSSGIFTDSAATQTVSTALILNATKTAFDFTNSGTGLLGIGAVTGAASTGKQTITVGSSSAGIIALNGVIGNGAAGGNVALTVNSSGTGVVGFFGANTYTGATSLNAGLTTVGISSTGPAGAPTNGAFGTGTLTFNGGQIRSGITTDYTVGNTVTIAADTTFANAASERTLTFSGPVTLSGGTRTLTSNVGTTVAGKTVNFSGAIDDGSMGFGLTKAGAGNLTLSGTNTYTGATTISAGTLSVGLAANMGAAASNLVFDGGTLQITGTTLTNFSGIGHTVSFNAGKTVSLNINDVANVFTADQFLNQTTGGFSKSGAGTAILDQSNTYTGVTTVNQGTLTLKNDQSAATGGFNVGSNVAAANPILNIGTGSTTTVAVASGNAFQIGTNGTGGIDAVVNVADLATVNNAGTLTIGRRGVLNVNSGATWNQSGDLTVRGWGNVADVGQGRAGLTVGIGGTFNYSGANTIKLPVAGGGNGFSGDNPGIVIQGTFSTGMGFESNLAQGTSTTTNGLAIDGGTLKFNAPVADIATATGSGATFPILVTLTNAAKIDTQTYNVGSSSKIGGTGSLTKFGSGTLTLTGTNTYTGSTTVNAGKLVVGVASVGSITSNVSVAAGAILGGSGTITGNVTLATNVGATPGGQLTVGNSPGVMTVVGTSNFNSGSIFSWDLTDNVNTSRGTNYDGLTSTNLTVASGAIFQVVLGGSVNRSDAFWNSNQNWADIFSVSGTTTPAGDGTLFDTFQIVDNTTGSLFTPVNGSFSFTGSTLTWSAVPEPSSILAGLLLGAGLLRRRRTA